MQTTEVIQPSTAPFLAIAPMPCAPLKPYRDRLLRLSDVRFLTGLGRSSIYAAIAEGTFPSAVNVTDYAVAYRMGFIWDSLKAAALARPEAEKKPQVAELGVLELGAFEGRKFLSPMQVRQLRAEASAAA